MDVELEHSFKYHFESDEVNAKFITISAFKMKQMETVAPIKEIVIKAMGKWAESLELSNEIVEEAQQAKKADVEKEAETMEGSQMMAIITMYCNEGDLAKLYAHMNKLLTSGVAYIDAGSTKFSGTHIKELDPGDFEILCGEYIGNFIT